jgi:biofilm protein TabA
MLIDHAERRSRYAGWHPGIVAALDFLGRTDFSDAAAGKQTVDGTRLLAIVNRYETKALADAVWESHRRYIDVQWMVSGRERMGFVPLDRSGAIAQPYDAERDVQFYAPAGDLFVIQPGQFAIFFPEDVHAPGLVVDKPEPVLKVVMKVAVEW